MPPLPPGHARFSGGGCTDELLLLDEEEEEEAEEENEENEDDEEEPLDEPRKIPNIKFSIILHIHTLLDKQRFQYYC